MKIFASNLIAVCTFHCGSSEKWLVLLDYGGLVYYPSEPIKKNGILVEVSF